MMFTLKLTKLKAVLNFPRYSLPYWLGNKFRGGFGSVLLKAVCSYLQPKCRECKSSEDCLYYALYEREKQKRGKSQPVKSIVFIPPFFGKSISGDGRISLEINIFGDYIRYLPHIIYGLRFLGKVGLNRESKYILENIADCFTKEVVYDGEINAQAVKTIDLSRVKGEKRDFVKVNFVTPMEIEKMPLSLNYLIHMIRRRLILFVNEYGSGEVPEYRCEDMLINSEWKKHRLVHTSKRLGRREFLAYTGSAEYKIVDADTNTFNLLSIGELIGAGAKSSFGMGFFKIK
jgi:CRISPR-associated endoribonuclease Cas6